MRTSQRAYALHRGVSLAAVQRGIGDGRIEPAPDGTIDPDAADRQWAANTIPRPGARDDAFMKARLEKLAFQNETLRLRVERREAARAALPAPLTAAEVYMAGVREALASPIPGSLKRVCRACLERLPIAAFDGGHRNGKHQYRRICYRCVSAGTNTQSKAYNAVCKRLAKIEAASFLCTRCKTQRPKILFRDAERTCLPCKVEVLEKRNATLLERVPRGDDWRRENATRRRHSDPAKCITRDARRLDLLLRQADGSLTAEVVGRLFAEAEGRPCPYCGIYMDRRLKSLDHMIPITKGGLHSVTNAIICCLKCNSRKGARDFGDWLTELKEPFASLSFAEYERRYGAVPAQAVLLLEFTGGDSLAVN